MTFNRDTHTIALTWEELKGAYDGLRAVSANYDMRGRGFATLTEARRLVEVEMREQGYEKQWLALTNS